MSVEDMLAQLTAIDALIKADADEKNRRKDAYDRFMSLVHQKEELHDVVLQQTGRVAYWTNEGYRLRDPGEDEAEGQETKERAIMVIKSGYTYETLIERGPMGILQEAEQLLGILTFCRERAAYAEYPEPKTPGEYLYWIEDEAEVQESTFDPNVDPDYILLLQSYATLLRLAGVVKVSPVGK